MTSNKPAVISFGAHIIDVLGWPVTRIPPGQQVDFLDRVKFTVAGTAAAVSMNLGKLSVPVYSVARLGDDLSGLFLRSALESFGADVSRVVTDPELSTSASMLPIRPDGSRPALHSMGANAALSEDDVPWDLVGEGTYFHLGGLFILPGVDGEPAARILRRAKELGAITTVDVIITPRDDLQEKLRPALPYVDYFLPNIEEAGLLVGSEDRPEIIGWLHDAGVGTTLLTLGEEGVSVAPNGQPETVVPAYQVELVDTTGCGDALTAGVISGLRDGLDVYAAAERGAAAGSLVASGLGSDAGLVDLPGLLAFQANTPRLK